MKLDDLIDKTCLIGLTYFNTRGEMLKQLQLAGTVIAIDRENGITVRLHPTSRADPIPGDDAIASDGGKPANFILPASLNGWYRAPPGHYRDAERRLLIENPQYLVTWDIHQTKSDTPEGEHEWWEWLPRTVPPQVR